MHIVRLVTVHEPDVAHLPRELRSTLTKQDIAAIRSGPEYFRRLAIRAELKWLRRLLLKCSEEPHELQFYSSGNSSFTPYFRFPLNGAALSLPRAARLRADLPDALRPVYSLIGAFQENGFDFDGGLHPSDKLSPVSETGMWVEPGGAIDPAHAIPVIETLAGSQLCYLADGSGAWLQACRFRGVRSLAREVARYFEAYLRGDRI
jgi:hypothetical protein